MKKSIIALIAATSMMTAGVSAQEDQASSGSFGIGAVNGPIVAGIGAGALVVAAIVSNNRSNGGTDEPVLTCEGSDPLVGDFCVGTTNTVTVSGTQTVTVPVTFTYAPTLQ